MFDIFWVIFRYLIEFLGLLLLLVNRKEAFIQVRMPNYIMALSLTSMIMGLLDEFIRYDNSQKIQYIGCLSYTLAYGILPIISCCIINLMTSKFFVSAILKDNAKVNLLRKICNRISGSSDDINNWQNQKLLQKLRIEKYLWIAIFILTPTTLDLITSGASEGISNFTRGFGLSECHPITNFVSIFFFSVTLGFNILLLHQLKSSKNDIFKVKQTFIGYLCALILYGGFLLFDILYSVFTDKFLFPFYIMACVGVLANIPFTFHPLYLLYKRKKKNILTIENIYNRNDYKNNFIAIAGASYCINYVTFINDYKNINWSKPLELQRFSKKYFDRNSPLYLELLLEDYDLWCLDLGNPDQYSLKILNGYVHMFLQKNIVDYLDDNNLKRKDLY